MKQNQTHYRMVFTILIIYLTISVGTALDFDSSSLEKLTLQSFLNGAWAEQTENYLQQHIGFHDTLFRIKSNIDLFLGEKMIQGVYITDDMLLEKLSSDDIPEPSVSAQPVNDFYEQTQIPTYFILVPSASDIYRTKLPANAVNAEQKNAIQQIYLSTSNGIHCIDAYNILSSLKDNYIYYRTDSHWTCCGAYYVYQSTIQKMGFTPISYQKYVISHMTADFYGDLYEKTLYDNIRADVLDYYYDESGVQITSITVNDNPQNEIKSSHLYDTSAFLKNNPYQFYLGQPCEKLTIRTNLNNHKKLLLYKDSFADCFIPFLIQHYNEICIINLEQTTSENLPLPSSNTYTHTLILSSLNFWNTYTKESPLS